MRLFVDNLTNVDFSYLCPERGLLGETWLAHIELTGGLDEQGMVCDFGVVKKYLRNWLDAELDHRLLVPTENSNLQLHSVSQAQQADLEFTLVDDNTLTMRSPAEAVTFIDVPVITPEHVAAWCERKLKDAFGETVACVKISFTSEFIDTPFYHYSHGLKKHQGNCQRIAHGHRSKILIWKNEVLDSDLMAQWALTFKDIYLGTQEDIAGETPSNWQFRYTAQQGGFELSLPKTCCYIMNTDTTVELIAQHIATTLKQAMPHDQFKVKTFEGLAKGAIVDI